MEQTQKVLWLLDFDGVINALDPCPDLAVAHWQQYTSDYSAATKHFDRLRWAPELIHRINRLAERGSVEIVWTSNRQWEIEDLALVVGLSNVTWNNARDYCDDHPWWKFSCARAQDPDRPLIWTDDDLPVRADITNWYDTRTNLMAFAPDPRYGILPAQMRQIERFVALHARQEVAV